MPVFQKRFHNEIEIVDLKLFYNGFQTVYKPSYFESSPQILFNLIQGCVAKADLPKTFPKPIFKAGLPGKEQTEVTRGKGDRWEWKRRAKKGIMSELGKGKEGKKGKGKGKTISIKKERVWEGKRREKISKRKDGRDHANIVSKWKVKKILFSEVGN